jgi:hypothetical protein
MSSLKEDRPEKSPITVGVSMSCPLHPMTSASNRIQNGYHEL